MPAVQRGANWTIIIAGGALFITVANSVLGAVIGGTDKIDKRVSQIENDLTWKYLSKEIAAKDLGYVNAALHDLKVEKAERDVYEQRIATIERILGFQRERMMEIERLLRSTPPRP